MNVFIFRWNQSRRGIKLALLLFIIMGSITSVYAQQNGSVSGIITDPETSEPLISATAVIEETKHAAGSMSGFIVKQHWEKEGVIIVKCNDVPNPKVKFHTEGWKIRTNISNSKQRIQLFI